MESGKTYTENELGNKPIHKFNNGLGAMICNYCRAIISIGKKTKAILCDQCKKDLIDAIHESPDIKAFNDQMDKEVHQNRGNLNK